MIKLIEPSIEYEAEFSKMVEDYNIHKENTFEDVYYKEDFDFNKYIKTLKDFSKGEGLPRDYAQSTELWLVNDKKEILGTIRIRHSLKNKNFYEGGNIGYDISPRFRKMGFGRIILKFALDKAKNLGLSKVLLTCDYDNIGSKKIIEYNGGVLENIIEREHGNKILRYWISL